MELIIIKEVIMDLNCNSKYSLIIGCGYFILHLLIKFNNIYYRNHEVRVLSL